MQRKPIRDYRDLVAWQQAIELAVECAVVADALPRRSWSLASQLRRAANSVHSNIAEGNGRPTTVDYVRHLGMSKASLNEVDNHLYFIGRKHPDIRGLADARLRVLNVARPLAGLVKSLKRKIEEGS